MGRHYRSSIHSFQIDDMSLWWTQCVMGNRNDNSLSSVTCCDWCGTRGHVEAGLRAVMLLRVRNCKLEVDRPSAAEKSVIEFLHFKCSREILISVNQFYSSFNAANANTFSLPHTLLNWAIHLKYFPQSYYIMILILYVKMASAGNCTLQGLISLSAQPEYIK